MLARREKEQKPLPSRKRIKSVKTFDFPKVKGFEKLACKLSRVKSNSLFNILSTALLPQPIYDEVYAAEVERMLEYLSRAFGANMPEEIEFYTHILHMLLKEYEEEVGVADALNIPPHELLRALLEDYNLFQKDLVPDCFASPSQVSEFLSQKKGRSKLTYEQAVALGEKFHVNFSCFLVDSGE